MSAEHPFVAALREEAEACAAAEDEFRRTMASRVAQLAEARAFANRRMNIMRALLETVGGAATPSEAGMRAVAALRERLGWREESDARDEVLLRYAELAGLAHAVTHDADDDAEAGRARLYAALRAFEDWYLAARGTPFWVLFEHYMPETQLVDF